MIESFEFAMILEIREWIKQLKENDGRCWASFMQALNEEFFMKDLKRVTKKTFVEYIALLYKYLSMYKLLKDFKRHYLQFMRTKKTSLNVEKMKQFIYAANPWLRIHGYKKNLNYSSATIMKNVD